MTIRVTCPITTTFAVVSWEGWFLLRGSIELQKGHTGAGKEWVSEGLSLTAFLGQRTARSMPGGPCNQHKERSGWQWFTRPRAHKWYTCINPLWPSDAIWWQIWLNTGSGNGLLPAGTKPLPEPTSSKLFCTIHLRTISQEVLTAHEHNSQHMFGDNTF